MSLMIKFILANQNQLKKKPEKDQPLGFGKLFTDYLFVMEYDQDQGWHDARIQPYQPLQLDPAALCFHYGQELFEGMKAYYHTHHIVLFRPKENFKRMQQGCHRLCMAPLDEALAFEGLTELLKIEKDWIPKTKGSSLYIRPVLIATEPALGVRASLTYLFFIILSPVGAYHPQGFNPLKIHVEDQFTRSAIGGTGYIKASGNYAGSILAAHKAHAHHCSQVLWLDAHDKKYAEEAGAMNIFFVMGDEIITPPLTGTILPGITRQSVIQLLKDWDQKIIERQISIDEIISGIESKKLTEIFGTGTAAIISPIGQLNYKEKIYTVNENKVGVITQKLYDYLLALQHDEIKDSHHWICRI